MNCYQETLREFAAVPFPNGNHQSVYQFLREHFGDNDIHQPYNHRRWVTVNRYLEYFGEPMIFFKDETDAVWFHLKWRQR